MGRCEVDHRQFEIQEVMKEEWLESGRQVWCCVVSMHTLGSWLAYAAAVMQPGGMSSPAVCTSKWGLLTGQLHSLQGVGTMLHLLSLGLYPSLGSRSVTNKVSTSFGFDSIVRIDCNCGHHRLF
jgi:hypothetical protein